MSAKRETVGFFLQRFPELPSGNTPVLMLTEDQGQELLLVKGLSKPKSAFASLLDPFLLLDLQILPHGEAKLLVGASVHERLGQYLHITYAQVEYLWNLIAIVTALTKGPADTELFHLYSDALRSLSSAPQPHSLVQGFTVQGLSTLGLLHLSPECLSCGKVFVSEDHVRLRPEDMLLLCEPCHRNMGLAVGLLSLTPLLHKYLRTLIRSSVGDLGMLHVPQELREEVDHILARRMEAGLS